MVAFMAKKPLPKPRSFTSERSASVTLVSREPPSAASPVISGKALANPMQLALHVAWHKTSVDIFRSRCFHVSL